MMDTLLPANLFPLGLEQQPGANTVIDATFLDSLVSSPADSFAVFLKENDKRAFEQVRAVSWRVSVQGAPNYNPGRTLCAGLFGSSA